MLIERYCPLLAPPRFTCATTAMPKTIRMKVPRNSASTARLRVGMVRDYYVRRLMGPWVHGFMGELRVQKLAPPVGAFADVEHRVVQALVAGVPELAAVGDDAVAAPVGRPGHGLGRVARLG